MTSGHLRRACSSLNENKLVTVFSFLWWTRPALDPHHCLLVSLLTEAWKLGAREGKTL